MKNLLVILALAVISVTVSAQDKIAHLRTAKRIITIEQPTAPYYSVQILALKNPPSDPSFFEKLDEVKEYPGQDGYIRYCVGAFNSYAEANSSIESLKAKGYEEAFVVNTNRFKLQSSSVNGSVKEIDPNKDYVVQLSAFRYPVYLTFFENVKDVYEYRLNDKIFRYTTKPVKGSQVRDLLAEMKSIGYKKAFIVEYEKYAPFRIE
ncbi:MAG: SPOR domain-containing protein [Bacteroidales bacterium]|nr:SPOR domain-containing protein [Bacteroidales bacterium]